MRSRPPVFEGTLIRPAVSDRVSLTRDEARRIELPGLLAKA
jgi:hypothetical protein